MVPVLMLVICIVIIAGMWKVFVKAGQPGWASIIPFVNIYFLCKIGGKPGWWLILFFVPIVNFIVAIILTVAVAEKFGKGIGFALGMVFLGFIFFPILGFGSAQYQGGAPAAEAPAAE